MNCPEGNAVAAAYRSYAQQAQQTK
jgi:hypothetical protein